MEKTSSSVPAQTKLGYTTVKVDFLETKEASDDHGNSYNCFCPRRYDELKSFVGTEFSTAAAMFTRNSGATDYYEEHHKKRLFLPGIVITFQGKKRFVPDITKQQYDDAFFNAPRQKNGIVFVDLGKIQTANQNDKVFEDYKDVTTPSCRPCMLYYITAPEQGPQRT